jgi:hypothetical protein
MKWKLIFAILTVMLLVGCAKPAEEAEELPEVTPPEEEEMEVIEVTPEEEEKAPVTTETISVMNRAVEPAELTVGAGSTIVFNMGEDVKGSRTIQV